MIRTLFARGAAALALLSIATISPAIAGSLTVKDGTGTAQSIGTFACQSTAQCYGFAPIDTTGTQINPATKELQQSILIALGLLLQPGGKVDTVIVGTPTDIGVTINTASAAQQLVAATARRGFSIQNQTTGDCYINATATATADFHSLKVAAGSYYETPTTHVSAGAISIICVATGGIYGRQW